MKQAVDEPTIQYPHRAFLVLPFGAVVKELYVFSSSGPSKELCVHRAHNLHSILTFYTICDMCLIE